MWPRYRCLNKIYGSANSWLRSEQTFDRSPICLIPNTSPAIIPIQWLAIKDSLLNYNEWDVMARSNKLPSANISVPSQHSWCRQTLSRICIHHRNSSYLRCIQMYTDKTQSNMKYGIANSCQSILLWGITSMASFTSFTTPIYCFSPM